MQTALVHERITQYIPPPAAAPPAAKCLLRMRVLRCAELAALPVCGGRHIHGAGAGAGPGNLIVHEFISVSLNLEC